MTEIPAQNYAPSWGTDTRTAPPLVGDEREILTAVLDWRWWFRQQFAGEDVPHLYYSDDDPDQDFDSLEGDVAEACAVWRAECECAREIIADTSSLDQTGIQRSPHLARASRCAARRRHRRRG